MRKNTSFEKVGEPARNFVVVVSSTTERPVTGLELKHFTVYLRDPDGVAAYQRTPSGGVVRDTVPVTMTELGSTGVYRVSFVPTSRGTWKLAMIHATYCTYGKRATYRVFDALYYVANESPLVEPFVVTDAAGNLQTGVPVSEFAALLYNPNLDEVSASVPVTIEELGAGDYEASYEADVTGKWMLILTHPTYFPWGKYNDQRFTGSDTTDIDVVEAIRNLIVDDADMRARLGTFAFTSGTYTPAVFTTDVLPENVDYPAVIVNRIGGLDWGTRGAEGEDTLIQVRIFGDRNRQTDVIRKSANVLRKLLNRAALTVSDGTRAFRCIADPPSAAPDEDRFPGYLITVRVLQLDVALDES